MGVVAFDLDPHSPEVLFAQALPETQQDQIKLTRFMSPTERNVHFGIYLQLELRYDEFPINEDENDRSQVENVRDVKRVTKRLAFVDAIIAAAAPPVVEEPEVIPEYVLSGDPDADAKALFSMPASSAAEDEAMLAAMEDD